MYTKDKQANRLSKNLQVSNFKTIGLVGTELFDADRQTERWKNGHEANSWIRNFANAPDSVRLVKNWTQSSHCTQWATLPRCYP